MKTVDTFFFHCICFVVCFFVCVIGLQAQQKAMAAAVKKMMINNRSSIDYNLQTGTYNVIFNGDTTIVNAYAECHSDKLYDSRLYTKRSFTKSPFKDITGIGVKYQVTLTGKGLPTMRQVFYVYSKKDFFVAELELLNAKNGCNSMRLLATEKLGFSNSGSKINALFVPFDNDAWIRYNSSEISDANFASSEVTALYNADNREGIIAGSLDHDNWKTGIRIKGIDNQSLSAFSVDAGYTDSLVTRDKKAHGYVAVGEAICKSPRIMVGRYADWRNGLEEYGQLNKLLNPPFVFNWTKAKPMGWNSWGAMQTALSLDKAKAVVDFFADSCKQFRTADNTLYIDLDSYWDKLAKGGMMGDFGELEAFAAYCKQRGLQPGIYWAPFVDWGKNANKQVEGSDYKYADCWTKVNGQYHDFDGTRAMDPTHPATKARINYLIGRFKACGFRMIKIDFIGHAAIEADGFYDKKVTTGMQAFKQSMEWLDQQLDTTMLIYAAISPNLATGKYVHMRRIACDAFKAINETEYTLNSVTYGWWLSKLYPYNDADHVVFGNEAEGANRARLASSIVTGTVVAGDDFSSDGEWLGKAKKLLQNSHLLALAQNNTSFKPIDGTNGANADNYFIYRDKSTIYLAVFNYSKSKMVAQLSPNKFGLKAQEKIASVTELFSSKTLPYEKDVEIDLNAEDAAIFKLAIQ